jgi:phytanoyl-CoA hydroxylase
MMLTAKQQASFADNGYVVVAGLFRPAEVAQYRDHFMTLRKRGSYPGDLVGSDPRRNDPLQRYPRMIHMHRWDDLSRRWLLEPRLSACLTALLGREPYAVQTMLYFKPPGARGQALHQDNFYLRAQPGTCLAAWLALDPCDEANGCLQVVPGSHTWPLLCTTQADTNVSFTDVTVPLPAGQPIQPVVMEAGDVLLFNGALVHGSYPNTSPDRFRRALIGHYIEGRAEQVAAFYQPALRMDGSELTLETSVGGGACGEWVEGEGEGEGEGMPVVQMTGHEGIVRKHE